MGVVIGGDLEYVVAIYWRAKPGVHFGTATVAHICWGFEDVENLFDIRRIVDVVVVREHLRDSTTTHTSPAPIVDTGCAITSRWNIRACRLANNSIPHRHHLQLLYLQALSFLPHGDIPSGHCWARQGRNGFACKDQWRGALYTSGEVRRLTNQYCTTVDARSVAVHAMPYLHLVHRYHLS